jgi:hypothetical protein
MEMTNNIEAKQAIQDDHHNHQFAKQMKVSLQ